ncbi:hypothetical protein [Pseudoxanthomonas winnipegensis]|nr:hypothetical protein [Pseudoxanthomonas winnipegensis]
MTEDASYTLMLSAAQVQILKDFVELTLSDTGEFIWADFRDPGRRAAVYQFRARPSYVPASRWLWRVSIQLVLKTPLDGQFVIGNEQYQGLTNGDGEVLST